jgi:hypothetical protein
MSSYGFDAPQQLRKKHLDEYRGFESMTSDQLFAALDDPACSPDRCILIATELVARGADTSGVVPLLRWILRGFDGNQTRYRAAIALARMGEWDAEIQTALQHITERYPRMHGDAKAAMILEQVQCRLCIGPAPESWPPCQRPRRRPGDESAKGTGSAPARDAAPHNSTR